MFCLITYSRKKMYMSYNENKNKKKIKSIMNIPETCLFIDGSRVWWILFFKILFIEYILK